MPDFGSFVVIGRDHHGYAVFGRLSMEVFCCIGGDRCERYGLVDFGRALPYGTCGGVFWILGAILWVKAIS